MDHLGEGLHGLIVHALDALEDLDPMMDLGGIIVAFKMQAGERLNSVMLRTSVYETCVLPQRTPRRLWLLAR